MMGECIDGSLETYHVTHHSMIGIHTAQSSLDGRCACAVICCWGGGILVMLLAFVPHPLGIHLMHQKIAKK